MAKYIKSHSNFVLSQKHQSIKDGTVLDRDITTIGGISDFPSSQVPIYRSGNFLISVRGGSKPTNEYNSENWSENDISGEVWTLESMSGMSLGTSEDDDTTITLKKDYYDFRDFAYYGSLTELFRASVTDIVSRFPGELYITDKNAYYTSACTIDGEYIEDSVLLGMNQNLRYISNPFGIDIHTALKPNDANTLKFFANEGYKNYEIIDRDGNASDIIRWEVTYKDYCKPNEKRKAANIKVNNMNLYAYVGDNNEIVYLSPNANIGVHIRPKKEFLTKFFNECDNFERLLMNKENDYHTDFSVIRENEMGYYRELVPFIFPRGEGGYNIDASDYGFNNYTQNMVDIGEYYDEKFTDNLWRSMTHEAIKNFDWTYTREYVEGDEEEYVLGGQRIQKALRIFGREFDEILSYIDSIKDINRVTYDERNNVPDYFLTDVVENSGWDVKLIYPYSLATYYIKNGVKTKLDDSMYSESGASGCGGQLNNRYDDGSNEYPLVREFSQDSNDKFVPYPFMGWGYFNMCSGITNSTSMSDTSRYDEKALGGKGAVKEVIRTYYDDVEWSEQKGNNEFLRRLKINSPYIWRNKGTVEGIEMILGMFGMRSKRWLDARGEDENRKPDFEVTEYTSIAKPILEPWDAEHQDYRINWVNSTKMISYDNRSISNYNKYGLEGNKMPYQGIPVAYRETYNETYIRKNSLEQQLNYLSSGDVANFSTTAETRAFKREDGTLVKVRYLYPNFEKGEQLDGNPYFQMDGGWLSKIIESNSATSYNFQYDSDNNIVYSVYNSGSSEYSSGDSQTLYKETIRNIRRVDNVNGLFSIPTNDLYNGVICSVTSIEKNSAVIDGVVYPIQTEWYYGADDTPKSVRYISLIKSDGYIKVGLNKYFDSTIIVLDGDGIETIYNLEDKGDGYEVKAHINSLTNSFICKEDSVGNYTIHSFVEFDRAWSGEGYSNYFILDDINYADELARWDSTTNTYTSGWRRLDKNSNDYLRVKTIENYFKGNNPHNGNMVYDNGHEYFTYFSRLFKYALDNDLFDGRCYDNLYQATEDEISKYGFSGLINPNEDVMQYDNFLIKDTKIHYFGNYWTSKNDGSFDKIYIYNQNIKKTLYYIGKYGYGNALSYILSNNNNSWIEQSNPYSGSGVVDEVTNQIVNNKRLLITFYLHNEWYTRLGQEEIKYIDDIIMNYLTQMIPSSTILQIKYKSA